MISSYWWGKVNSGWFVVRTGLLVSSLPEPTSVDGTQVSTTTNHLCPGVYFYTRYMYHRRFLLTNYLLLHMYIVMFNPQQRILYETLMFIVAIYMYMSMFHR